MTIIAVKPVIKQVDNANFMIFYNFILIGMISLAV